MNYDDLLSNDTVFKYWITSTTDFSFTEKKDIVIISDTNISKIIGVYKADEYHYIFKKPYLLSKLGIKNLKKKIIDILIEKNTTHCELEDGFKIVKKLIELNIDVTQQNIIFKRNSKRRSERKQKERSKRNQKEISDKKKEEKVERRSTIEKKTETDTETENLISEIENTDNIDNIDNIDNNTTEEDDENILGLIPVLVNPCKNCILPNIKFDDNEIDEEGNTPDSIAKGDYIPKHLDECYYCEVINNNKINIQNLFKKAVISYSEITSKDAELCILEDSYFMNKKYNPFGDYITDICAKVYYINDIDEIYNNCFFISFAMP